MRDSKKLLTALVLAAAFVVSALPAAAQTGRIGGTIKDGQGQPIKGATVTAENPSASPSSFTATTDDKGRYSIIGLKSGGWKITAVAPGFAPASGQVPVRTIGAPMPPVDFIAGPGQHRPDGRIGRRQHQGTPGRAGEGRGGDERPAVRRRHRRLPGHPRPRRRRSR